MSTTDNIKNNFKKNKKQLIIVGGLAFVGVAALGFTVLRSTGEPVGTNSQEQTSIGNTNQADSVVNSINPDTESLVDPSSPVSQNAFETEQRNAQEARDSGDTYLGDIFFEGQRNGAGSIQLTLSQNQSQK